MANPLIFLATGDVAPRRDDLPLMFDGVRDALAQGDLVFGQLETTLSDRGSPLPQARLAMRAPPHTASAIREAGFDVMSFAGNHAMDWGLEAFADTLVHAEAAGITVCGSGADIAQARRPAIMEAQGVKVAVLAYSSILPMGYEATDRRPGCAPLRGHTLYEQIEHDQPGTPARVHTFCHREDLAALKADVAAAKAQSDIVAVSVHWGIHFIEAEIADYQRDYAHAAIEAGADVILGHHPHILKGVAFHQGKPIFYSLANFAIEQPQDFADDLFSTQGFKEISALADFDTKRAYILPPDAQKTLIAKLTIEGGAITRVAFLPCQIRDTNEPDLLAPGDPRFGAVVDYMDTISRAQGLGVRYVVEGDEVAVTPSRF